MKWTTAIVVGISAVVVVAALRVRRQRRPLEITTADLGYQERSPEDLASENLIDLNTASEVELSRLGLNVDAIDRIVDNRPYRNKLDLLSRMVLTETAYEIIKRQVGVARATESVKVAG